MLIVDNIKFGQFLDAMKEVTEQNTDGTITITIDFEGTDFLSLVDEPLTEQLVKDFVYRIVGVIREMVAIAKKRNDDRFAKELINGGHRFLLACHRKMEQLNIFAKEDEIDPPLSRLEIIDRDARIAQQN